MSVKLTGEPYEDEATPHNRNEKIRLSMVDSDYFVGDLAITALFYPGAMERLAMVLGESYYVGCAGDDRAILIGESFMSLERFQKSLSEKISRQRIFLQC